MKEDKCKKGGGTFNLGRRMTIGLIVVAIVSITGSYILWYLDKRK